METGAQQIIVALVSIEYWSEWKPPLYDPDVEVAPVALRVEPSSYGDYFSFDVAQAESAEAVDGCLTDSLVVPTTVVRQQEPSRA